MGKAVEERNKKEYGEGHSLRSICRAVKASQNMWAHKIIGETMP